MKRKVFKSVLSAALVVTMSLSGMAPVASAAEIGKAFDQKVVNQNEGSMQELQFSEKELPVTPIPEKEYNIMDRQPEKEIQVDKGISLHKNAKASISNTDPNYALPVQSGMLSQGVVAKEGEMRWYGFALNTKSKVTILLEMVESLDADVYLYSLDEESYTLNFVGASARAGLGVSETATASLDAGVYYFAIAGYEGSGDFIFAYFESSADADYEVNDTLAQATPVKLGTNITGVIDSIVDVDYYKVTIDEPKIMDYTITTKDGYSLLLVAKSGSESAIYPGYNDTQFTKFMPGTYYFAVYSEENKYSATSAYTIRFREVGAIAEDTDANVICYSEEAGIIFQANELGTECYVNGAKIDISYSYYNRFSNSAGSQMYDIAINHRDDVFAILNKTSMYRPEAVYYHSSTRPAMSVGKKPVLMLTYCSGKNFYKVHSMCSGAYRDNSIWEDFAAVTVLVDPDTGKLVDIVNFNYYYDFIGGSNRLTYTTPYKTNFN